MLIWYSITGASGITLAARLLNVSWGEKIKKRFEKALAEEFTQQDGTIMAIRSELTGYTVSNMDVTMYITDFRQDPRFGWPSLRCHQLSSVRGVPSKCCPPLLGLCEEGSDQVER
jgi:hypothetical protein